MIETNAETHLMWRRSTWVGVGKQKQAGVLPRTHMHTCSVVCFVCVCVCVCVRAWGVHVCDCVCVWGGGGWG